MKKYRVSTTNVPIFIEIRSGDKIRSIIFERSYGLQNGQTSKMAENEDRVRLAKPVHIAQNQSKCFKIQMKILIYLIYWISRPYLPPINSCFTNILNQ